MNHYNIPPLAKLRRICILCVPMVRARHLASAKIQRETWLNLVKTREMA